MSQNKFDYEKIYDLCRQAAELEIGIFDFEENSHVNNAASMEDVYKFLVFHSQNRAQGGAFNFFKAYEEGKDVNVADAIWNCIEKFHFNLHNEFSYVELGVALCKLPETQNLISLESGKDIQFLELAKTCQCAKRFLRNYTFDTFCDEFTFGTNAKKNLAKINQTEKQIYNMGTALVSDFFKELGCIKGREFLVKSDVHVRRFFQTLFKTPNLTDNKLYTKVLDMYNMCTDTSKTPYKLDKYVYLLGVKRSVDASIKFAEAVRKKACLD